MEDTSSSGVTERGRSGFEDGTREVPWEKVVPEDPPRGESQSNGTVEEAGKILREFVRVLREHVQDKAEVEPGASDVIVLWMVRWVAMMVSRFLVGKGSRRTRGGMAGNAGSRSWRSARRCGTRRSGWARSAPTSWRASCARGFGWDTAAGRMRPSSGRVKVFSEPTLSSAWMRRAAGTPSISRRSGDPAAVRPVTPRVGHPDQSEHRPAARGVTSTRKRASR